MGSARGTQSRLRQREDGATLVEFALLAPLIFALLLGMFTGGLALSRKNSMTSAVRESARLGATLPNSTTWATTVQNRVLSLAPGDISAAEVCVKLVITTGTDAEPTESTQRSTACALPAGTEPSTANIPRNQCVTKVWARTSSPFQVIFFNRNLILDAASVSRYERGSPPSCSPT